MSKRIVQTGYCSYNFRFANSMTQSQPDAGAPFILLRTSDSRENGTFNLNADISAAGIGVKVGPSSFSTLSWVWHTLIAC